MRNGAFEVIEAMCVHLVELVAEQHPRDFGRGISDGYRGRPYDDGVRRDTQGRTLVIPGLEPSPTEAYRRGYLLGQLTRISQN